MQTAGGNHLFMEFLPIGANFINARFFACFVERFVSIDGGDPFAGITAQHDIRSPSGHIGSDGNHAGTARLSDDFGFVRMLLGIEHLMRQFFLVKQLRQDF